MRMRRRQIALLAAMLVVATASVGAPNRIQPRNALPEVKVSRGGGTALALKSRLSERPALLLLRRGAVSMQECKTLSKLSGDVTKANLTLILSVPDAHQGCVPDGACKVETSLTAVAAVGGNDFGPEVWRVIIVDTSGIVRVVRDIPAGGIGLNKVHELASTWEAGRLSFITNCGHCPEMTEATRLTRMSRPWLESPPG